MNGLALCAGVGGLELGLRDALGVEYQTVGWVECDDYAIEVLKARIWEGELDSAPIWDDLRTFDGHAWRGAVDLVSAGFPCQPYSTASRGRRIAVDLWPEVLRVVRECLPSLVFLENVSERAIRIAAADLRSIGFSSRITRLGSAELGAAHQRPRWWLLAHSDHAEEPAFELDAEVAGISAAARAHWQKLPSGILGMDDGTPNRVDRLRCVGNGASPSVAAAAFCVLAGGMTA